MTAVGPDDEMMMLMMYHLTFSVEPLEAGEKQINNQYSKRYRCPRIDDVCRYHAYFTFYALSNNNGEQETD